MKHKRLKVYLSGGMEYAKNEGVDWRSDLDEWIKQNLKHSVFNPNVESDKYLRKIMSNNEFRCSKESDIKAYTKIVKHFVDQDSNEIALRSDYVICLWDASAQRGAGTKGELTIARYFKKPVYMVTRIPKTKIPGWVLGCVNEFFPSFDELKAYLYQKYASQ
ncbi:MAG: hypothetical protein NTX44_07295 [Ignavibacteriales bacterium]|nr:hypothetical protein [Ignavibacteriales bacterium]